MNGAIQFTLVVFGLPLSALLCSVVRGDEIQLVNGDVISAAVVSLDGNTLKLKSELLGDLTIDRAKVRQITLGERLPAKSAGAAAAQHGAPGRLPAKPLGELLKDLQAGGAAQLAPDVIVKQFEAGGGDAGTVEELKKSLPLLASPEVQAYFRKQVGGLLDGSLNVDDIRREAIRARNETRAMLKDFGPEVGAALAPYLGILDKFIDETDPGKQPAASSSRPAR